MLLLLCSIKTEYQKDQIKARVFNRIDLLKSVLFYCLLIAEGIRVNSEGAIFYSLPQAKEVWNESLKSIIRIFEL